MTALQIIHGCRTIQLNQGFNTLIDEEDYPGVVGCSWHAAKTAKKSWYVHSWSGRKGKAHASLHRFLLGDPPGKKVDHRNGDTFDNRKANLRVCTQCQNLQNRRRFWGRSRYKGVNFDKYTGKWMAKLMANGKFFYLGRYQTEEEAARAYDVKAREVHGEFSCTNSDIYGDY